MDVMNPDTLTYATPTLTVWPFRTPTLPPATHTNMVLVGAERIWIVDPATPWQDERERMASELTAVLTSDRALAGIVLTHHHADHVGGAAWLAERFGLEVWAHPATQGLVGEKLQVQHVLNEGDVLEGSSAANDRWHVLHTPGHASDHVVLWEPVGKRVVGGDMMASVGTIVIDPADGDMAIYLEQLRRLRALAPTEWVPSHGAVITDPVGRLDHYIQHRLAREAKVLAALTADDEPLLAVTRRAYPELDPRLYPLAARSALAHLIKLRQDGRALGDTHWRRRE